MIRRKTIAIYAAAIFLVLAAAVLAISSLKILPSTQLNTELHVRGTNQYFALTDEQAERILSALNAAPKIWIPRWPSALYEEGYHMQMFGKEEKLGYRVLVALRTNGTRSQAFLDINGQSYLVFGAERLLETADAVWTECIASQSDS